MHNKTNATEPMVKRLKTLFVMLFFAMQATGYEFAERDFSIQGFLGPSLNFIRYDVVTKETPYSGFLVGIGMDWVWREQVSLIGMFRPVFADGALDVGVGFGAKYRAVGFDIPLFPYASGMVTGSFLFPLKVAARHTNLGLRSALGLDYFLAERFFVSLEVALEPSLAWIGDKTKLEMTLEPLLAVSWRF